MPACDKIAMVRQAGGVVRGEGRGKGKMEINVGEEGGSHNERVLYSNGRRERGAEVAELYSLGWGRGRLFHLIHQFHLLHQRRLHHLRWPSKGEMEEGRMGGRD